MCHHAWSCCFLKSLSSLGAWWWEAALALWLQMQGTFSSIREHGTRTESLWHSVLCKLEGGFTSSVEADRCLCVHFVLGIVLHPRDVLHPSCTSVLGRVPCIQWMTDVHLAKTQWGFPDKYLKNAHLLHWSGQQVWSWVQSALAGGPYVSITAF